MTRTAVELAPLLLISLAVCCMFKVFSSGSFFSWRWLWWFGFAAVGDRS